MIYVVDTHALIWFLERSARLGKTARQALVDPSSELVLPTIVLAETRYLAGTRRIRPSWEGLADAIRADGRFHTWELDQTIVELMPVQLEMHYPIIVATALDFVENLSEEATVITRDRAIRDSGLIPTVW